MDYLCLAVKREAARSQTGSREQAREYFIEKFGDCVRAKLEEEKKKLEGRVRYYDRKAEKHRREPEEKEEWLRREKEAQRELECVRRQLEGEWEQLQVWSFEDKYECFDEVFDNPVFGESVLMLHMAKVCRVGSGFQVVEEGYSCRVWREAGDKGIAEIRDRIPEDIAEDCISLDICRERPDTAQQFRVKIKRMTTEARRKFRAAANGGIL